MKSIYDKVKRFGSPVRSLQIQENNKPILSSEIITKKTNDIEDDQENNKYNEYETKYILENTPHKVIFSQIYDDKRLGCDGSIYYTGSSGHGASYEYNKDEFIPFYALFL